MDYYNYFDRYFKMNIFFWQNFKEINAMRLGVLIQMMELLDLENLK